MWNKLCLSSLLAVVYTLLSHVRSQATESPEFYQNLTCVTHDFANLSCRWETPGFAGSAIRYEICSRSLQPESCYETRGNSLQVEFHMYAPVTVKVQAKNIPQRPQISFEKYMGDVPYVPHTPQILSLVGDDQSDILYVEWTVDSSSVVSDTSVTWEIHVLRGENLHLVRNETFTVHWDLRQTTFRWNWSADFPLTCTSHSVKIRCFINDDTYYGEIRPSEWSAISTIADGSEEDAVYPTDKVVPVGANMTFCCKLKDNNSSSVGSIQFGITDYPLVDLGTGSYGIQLFHMNLSSGTSGDNVVCYSPDMDVIAGSVVFVGTPPDEPERFSCEARDLSIINCTWRSNSTGLYGDDRGTRYTIYEKFSGINLTCSGHNEDLDEHNCSYDAKKEQDLYEFLLVGTNPLGSANTSLLFNIREKIHPLRVEEVSLRGLSPTSVFISWFLPGTFQSVNLLCEAEIHNIHGDLERRNMTVNGANGAYYTYTLYNLHPFTDYNFRVRCSSRDHFWKWSHWSKERSHKTAVAAPSKKLDIWAEPAPNAKHSIIVYWKHLQPREANGDVISYNVEWRPLHSNESPQLITLPRNLNRTLINLTGTNNTDYEITVTASNSAGSSPPSVITTVQLLNEVDVDRVVGDDTGVNISWYPGENFTCGYVVKWIPSSHLQGTDLHWKRFSPRATNAVISLKHNQGGVRYNVSVYGCSENQYQLTKRLTAYMKELSPKAAPNFTIQETTSHSIVLKWEAIPEEELRGFLQGYLVYVVKYHNDSSVTRFLELAHHPDKKVKNITDPSVRALKIEDLQSGTSYQLGVQAYTGGGQGPVNAFSVVTKDNAVGLILAILIPIVVAVVLGIVTSTICYQKREWIKETFYPDIPNPENSKALQFQKSVSEGTKTIKTLEMNPCTPNNVEVVESFYAVPKVLDTELNSPSEGDHLPEDGSEAPEDNHIVISYYQPTAQDDTSNPVLDESATPSQVIYIDIQSMYQPQANSEEETENDLLDVGGYKPQMQLPINSVTTDTEAIAEETLAETAGYRPQGHPNTWAIDSPGSPTSIGSENASFGSPCSTNSRHFLIPSVDNKDSLKPTHAGWSISSLFQNKQDD
ncbi:leukemia inhibitory factor receptor-like [Hyperolius riggenbachi]|uniref:leukemia inhibitory factor receptor-like n=1 Tax=Hyperolius riggenbachi TaxID=752182 RepID=UPI0035A2E30C